VTTEVSRCQEFPRRQVVISVATGTERHRFASTVAGSPIIPPVQLGPSEAARPESDWSGIRRPTGSVPRAPRPGRAEAIGHREHSDRQADPDPTGGRPAFVHPPSRPVFALSRSISRAGGSDRGDRRYPVPAGRICPGWRCEARAGDAMSAPVRTYSVFGPAGLIRGRPGESGSADRVGIGGRSAHRRLEPPLQEDRRTHVVVGAGSVRRVSPPLPRLGGSIQILAASGMARQGSGSGKPGSGGASHTRTSRCSRRAKQSARRARRPNGRRADGAARGPAPDAPGRWTKRRPGPRSAGLWMTCPAGARGGHSSTFLFFLARARRFGPLGMYLLLSTGRPRMAAARRYPVVASSGVPRTRIRVPMTAVRSLGVGGPARPPRMTRRADPSGVGSCRSLAFGKPGRERPFRPRRDRLRTRPVADRVAAA